MEENKENVEETNLTENQEIVKNETTEENTEKVEEVVAKEEKKTEENFVKTEDFDWDEFESESDSYSSNDRAKLEEIYNKTLSTITENEVVDGTVIAKTAREVVINIGYKS